MNHFIQKLKYKLEEIQNSDDITKKRWLWGLSALSMSLVLAVWIGYMNMTINTVDSGASLEKKLAPETALSERFSRWSGAAIYQIYSSIYKVISQIDKPNKLEIKKDNFNFTPED